MTVADYRALGPSFGGPDHTFFPEVYGCTLKQVRDGRKNGVWPNEAAVRAGILAWQSEHSRTMTFAEYASARVTLGGPPGGDFKEIYGKTFAHVRDGVRLFDNRRLDDGSAISIAEMARRAGLTLGGVHQRLRSGKSPQQVVDNPGRYAERVTGRKAIVYTLQDGSSITTAELSTRTGLNRSTIQEHLQKGVSPQAILDRGRIKGTVKTRAAPRDTLTAWRSVTHLVGASPEACPTGAKRSTR